MPTARAGEHVMVQYLSSFRCHMTVRRVDRATTEPAQPKLNTAVSNLIPAPLRSPRFEMILLRCSFLVFACRLRLSLLTTPTLLAIHTLSSPPP